MIGIICAFALASVANCTPNAQFPNFGGSKEASFNLRNLASVEVSQLLVKLIEQSRNHGICDIEVQYLIFEEIRQGAKILILAFLIRLILVAWRAKVFFSEIDDFLLAFTEIVSSQEDFLFRANWLENSVVNFAIHDVVFWMSTGHYALTDIETFFDLFRDEVRR